MSTSSAHADSEKGYLRQIESLCLNNIEKKNGRDQAGGKAETKWQKKIQRRQRNLDDVGEQKVPRSKMNCTEYLKAFMTKHL